MARTLADLDLTAELQRLRESIPAGSRELIHPAQGFALGTVRTTREALTQLGVWVAGALKLLPEAELQPDHPLVRALSSILGHPQADREVLELFPEPLRKKVEEAVAARPSPWDAGQLEWQLIQYAAMAGDRASLDPLAPLTRQHFAFKPLEKIWNALLDLEVLRAWGLIN